MELLCAAQGVDFHKPLKTSPSLNEAMIAIRKVAPHYDKDRYFHPDIEAVKALIREETFLKLMPDGLLPSVS